MGAEPLEQKLAAILYADVAGYSRLTGEDEIGTHRTLSAYLDAIAAQVERHAGRVVHYAGDAVLAEFGTVSSALTCAVNIQCELQARNDELDAARRVQFRIGVNVGEVIVDRDDIYGEGVNIAARLESLAQPGGVCVSGAVHDAVGQRLPLDYEFLGEQRVKNIARAIRAYRVALRPGSALPPPLERSPARGAAAPARRTGGRVVGWLSAGVLAAAGLGALTWYEPWVPREEPASLARMAHPLPASPSIAVLPFANLSGDPGQEYFGDGLTENLITMLSQVPDMFVIARNSTFTYKGRAVKVQQVAEELGVRYVLEGSFQRSADRLRVHAQFIDALSGKHLWAQRYDRDWTEVFALQDDLTQRITSALSLRLSKAGRERLARRYTENVEAYDEFLRGQALYFQFTAQDNALAREHYRRAVELDPRFARAYGALALTHASDFRFDWNGAAAEALEQSLALASEAVALDAGLPQAHLVLGNVQVLKARFEEAIAAAETAIALDRNYADAYVLMAIIRSYTGRADEAVELMTSAMRLNPRPAAIYYLALGRAQYFAGRLRAAQASLRRAVELNPTFLLSQVFLTAAHSRLGESDEAEWQAAQLLALDPGFTVEAWMARESIVHPPYRVTLAEDLRRAGLAEKSAPASLEKPSIVVLPFDNMSPDPEQEYFADGISEDLTTDLSRLSGLFVVARNAAFAYKGAQADVRRVSQELGVRYALEGSVRRAGDRVRINAQLIDAVTGGHLWAQRYDGRLDDVFDLQDQVVRKIVTALEVHLSDQEERMLEHRYTDSGQAYDHFLRGQALWSRFTREDNEAARQMFAKAIEIDPRFARAYGALALTHVYAARFKWSAGFQQSMRQGRVFAERAMALDDSLPQVQLAMGTVRVFSKQPAEAIAAARRAAELDPGYADAFALLSFALTNAGRAAEALDAIQKAFELTPRPPSFYYLHRGRAHYLLGQMGSAIASLEKAVELNASFLVSHLFLAAAYAEAGRVDDAQWQLEQVRAMEPRFSVALWAADELFTDEAYLAALVAGLRKAGLTE